MGRLSGFKYREVVRKLRACGLEFNRQGGGSHEIWFNPKNQAVITIPRHSTPIAEGTLRAILRDAGIDVQKFLDA